MVAELYYIAAVGETVGNASSMQKSTLEWAAFYVPAGTRQAVRIKQNDFETFFYIFQCTCPTYKIETTDFCVQSE